MTTHVLLHLEFVASVLLGLAIVDLVVLLRMLNTHDSRTRWFFLHCVGNTLICVFCWPSVCACLVEPRSIIDSVSHPPTWTIAPGSKLPLIVVNCLHIYHILMFPLETADWIHHMIFIPALGIPGQVYNWGLFCNWLAFFLCGVPGAIDYALLGFKRCGYVTPALQKHVSVFLNAYIRQPFVLIGMGMTYDNLTRGNYDVPRWALLLQYIFCPLNVIYYTNSVIRSQERSIKDHA